MDAGRLLTRTDIEELDLSRNRFERLQDVAQLCSALPKLHALRISGNRFRSLTVSTPAAFENIVSLEISNVLLTWPEISALLVLFPRLTTLVAPHNNISAVPDPAPLPHTLNVLDLSSNTLTALSALSPLSALPSLSTLIISHNAISTLSHPTSTVFPALTTLDMAFNALTTFQELDHLPAATPALSSLRVSHNPAYDGVSLDDGHMLTIARLAPSVSVLNHSVITLKERENAEIWYLSRIGRQLVAAVASEDAARVLAEHRRWKELCALHGEPVVAADLSANEKMLEAGLVNMEFWKGGRSVERKMPKGTPVSVVRGCVGRWFGVRPLGVRLVCAKEGGEKVVMEEVGDTRDLGMYLDAGKWRVQVEVMEVELHRISFAY